MKNFKSFLYEEEAFNDEMFFSKKQAILIHEDSKCRIVQIMKLEAAEHFCSGTNWQYDTANKAAMYKSDSKRSVFSCFA
jgi:hypothetical protein